MATGFPAATGDVLSAAMYNGLTSFTVGTANTADTQRYQQTNIRF